MVEMIQELRFVHLNDAQPEHELEVVICDGAGTHRIAQLYENEEGEDERDDGLTSHWYCEDTDETYDLSVYPFWATIPHFEFPEKVRNQEMMVFLKDAPGTPEVVNDTYEIVGSEIRAKK